MSAIKIYSEEEALDRVLGPVGSEARDQYEADMRDFLVGHAIREAREKRNMTQEQLGQVIDVSKYSILLYEKGKNYPDVRGLIGLADYFGVSTDYLLGRTDNPEINR